jgi:hypothetical protein
VRARRAAFPGRPLPELCRANQDVNSPNYVVDTTSATSSVGRERNPVDRPNCSNNLPLCGSCSTKTFLCLWQSA